MAEFERFLDSVQRFGRVNFRRQRTCQTDKGERKIRVAFARVAKDPQPHADEHRHRLDLRPRRHAASVRYCNRAIGAAVLRRDADDGDAGRKHNAEVGRQVHGWHLQQHEARHRPLAKKESGALG